MINLACKLEKIRQNLEQSLSRLMNAGSHALMMGIFIFFEKGRRSSGTLPLTTCLTLTPRPALRATITTATVTSSSVAVKWILPDLWPRSADYSYQTRASLLLKSGSKTIGISNLIKRFFYFYISLYYYVIIGMECYSSSLDSSQSL